MITKYIYKLQANGQDSWHVDIHDAASVGEASSANRVSRQIVFQDPESTPSTTLSGSYTLSGSFNATLGITGSLMGTASYAQTSLTSSHSDNSIVTASISSNIITFSKGDGTTFPLTVSGGGGGVASGDELWTIELIDAQSVDFYAPYNLIISSSNNIVNSPTIQIKDDGVTYTLGNTISVGSKITVNANTASVINLNITR
jgi:hypothetical protein